MLPRCNNILIDNGMSLLVSYNIHTLLMYECHLITVLIFLAMPKITALAGIPVELLCLQNIA